MLRAVAKMEQEFSVYHQQVTEHLGKFDELPDLAICPGDEDVPRRIYLRSLIEDASRDPAAFEALGLLAARVIDAGDPMPDELRQFAVGVLRGHIQPPVSRGAPPVPPARNVLIHALLMDIVDQFGVTPMRNKGATIGDSACDIVAEAMPREARLPKSYSQIEAIWLRGQRADLEAEDNPTN